MRRSIRASKPGPKSLFRAIWTAGEPMACHGLAECADIGDKGHASFITYVFSIHPVFFESRKVHQTISNIQRFFGGQKVVTGVRSPKMDASNVAVDRY
jgi:hypothetical protein